MRAVVFGEFGAVPEVCDLPDPEVPDDGVVVRVEATGLCRSDVHAWLGHDGDVRLPHVPGHEFVGTVVGVGAGVRQHRPGERVTVPFVCACGQCPECARGDAQVCLNQTQPGFTHHGSYAELVALHRADANLVTVPDDLDAGAAALLGCRFATAYRGLVQQAQVAPDDTVLVVGCGGVGLSAVMIAVASGARVVGVDVDPDALQRATALGAVATVDVRGLSASLADEAVADAAPGFRIAVDATGRPDAIDLSLRTLRPRGIHVQIGLVSADPVLRVSRIISKELAFVGSHGMAARSYPGLLALVASGRLRPQDLVSTWIGLADVPSAMAAMRDGTAPAGVTMIRP